MINFVTPLQKEISRKIEKIERSEDNTIKKISRLYIQCV